MNKQNFTKIKQGKIWAENKKIRAIEINKLRNCFNNSTGIDPLSAYVLCRNTLEKKSQQFRKQEKLKEQEMLRQEQEALARKSIWLAKQKEKQQLYRQEILRQKEEVMLARKSIWFAKQRENQQLCSQEILRQKDEEMARKSNWFAKQKEREKVKMQRLERFRQKTVFRLRATGAPEEQLQILLQKSGKEFLQYRTFLYEAYPNKKGLRIQRKLQRETHEVIILDGDEHKPPRVNNGKKRTFPQPIGIRNIYPMSEDQQEIVKRSIIDVIAKITESGTGPRFTRCTFMDGWMHVICEDDYSRDWLVNLVENNHKPWPDAKLSIIPSDKLPTAMEAAVRVPRSYAKSYYHFQKLLKTYNKGLDPSKWKVNESVITKKKLSLVLQLDEQSVSVLRGLNCTPSLGPRKNDVTFKLREQFRYLKKYKKNNRSDLNVASTSKIHSERVSIQDIRSKIDDMSDINKGSPEEKGSSQNSQEAWGENMIPDKDNWSEDPETEGNLTAWGENIPDVDIWAYVPEIEGSWTDSDYSGEDWNNDSEEDESSPSEYTDRSEPCEEDNRNIHYNQNDKMENQCSSDPHATETRRCFRDDPVNDRQQPPQNFIQFQLQTDTQRQLEERCQQNPDIYPQSQYAYDRYSSETFNRDSRSLETQDKYESIPSGSGSQGFWGSGPVRQEHKNYRETPETLSSEKLGWNTQRDSDCRPQKHLNPHYQDSYDRYSSEDSYRDSRGRDTTIQEYKNTRVQEEWESRPTRNRTPDSRSSEPVRQDHRNYRDTLEVLSSEKSRGNTQRNSDCRPQKHLVPNSRNSYDRYSSETYNTDNRGREIQEEWESRPMRNRTQDSWSSEPVRQDNNNYRDSLKISNVPSHTTGIPITSRECQNWQSQYMQSNQRSINLSQPSPNNAFWRPPTCPEPNPNSSYWKRPTSLKQDPNNFSGTQQTYTRQFSDTWRNSSVPFQNDLRVTQSTVKNNRNIEDVRRNNSPPNWPRSSR